MKLKYILTLITLISLCLSFVGCDEERLPLKDALDKVSEQNEQLNKERSKLITEVISSIRDYSLYKESLDSDIDNLNILIENYNNELKRYHTEIYTKEYYFEDRVEVYVEIGKHVYSGPYVAREYTNTFELKLKDK